MKTLFIVPIVLVLFSGMAFAQFQHRAAECIDIFVMGGSDFVRPGLAPRVNLNIGVGHTFSFLHKNPFGDELTFSYTYENGGSHGFFHTRYSSHTENIGLMKNFNLLKYIIITQGKDFDKVTFYTWPLIGVTSMTGNPKVMNRLYGGAALGSIIHFNAHNAIWVQETWNKVVTVPWYTSTSIGYTVSF